MREPLPARRGHADLVEPQHLVAVGHGAENDVDADRRPGANQRDLHRLAHRGHPHAADDVFRAGNGELFDLDDDVAVANTRALRRARMHDVMHARARLAGGGL